MHTESDPWDEVVRLTEPTAEERKRFETTDQFWDAITKFDMTKFDTFIEQLPSLRYSENCFFHAIEVGNLEAVEAFLSFGLDPNTADESGRTPLWVASRFGGELIVRRLVEAGANPNLLPEDIDPETECRGESALFYAALYGNEELVAYLWDRSQPEVRRRSRELIESRLNLLIEPGPTSRKNG